MHSDTLNTFIDSTRAAFGPLTTELAATVRAELARLAQAPSSEPWLHALHEEAPASKDRSSARPRKYTGSEARAKTQE